MSTHAFPSTPSRAAAPPRRQPHRFERDAREAFDDGWDRTAEEGAEARRCPHTEVTWEDARSVISEQRLARHLFRPLASTRTAAASTAASTATRGPPTATSTSRPAWTSRPRSSPSATSPRCCARELARKAYQPQLIAIGTATDCYQPVERELRLTRSVIEVLHETSHPFSLVTKSSGGGTRPRPHRADGARKLAARVRHDHDARCANSPASWSRAPRRRTGACARCARWPTPACRAA